jgi:tetraacyldisaccharide 4'-kinase
MTPPAFWQQDGWRARALAPAAAVVAALTARRLARPGWRAPVPVLCCGNATVGGAGKTTVALDLGARLRARGVAVHYISRGYGGQVRGGPLLVDPAAHTASLVGDEPLLLAQVAPTWVGADRAASARAAVAAGAAALLMDDGLQNPGLVQDAGLLVIDGATGFGNGRVMPAGPLREPAAAAAGRCRAAIMIGMDQRGARAALPPGLPVLEAWLVPDQGLHGRRVLAFAGIARPAKFHATLLQAGATVAATMDFPDHHRFTPRELQAVLARARAIDAVPVTTPKDAVRLSAPWRHQVRAVGVGLAWASEAGIEALLRQVVP